ncbi:MAG: acetyltransferase [Sandaracinaceae bacterium]
MDIVLWGTGGHAREILQVALDQAADGEDLQVVGFLDQNADMHGREVHGLPVLGDQTWLARRPEIGVTVAVGNPVYRAQIVRTVVSNGHTRFVALRHPMAWVGRRVEIGPGTQICAGTTVPTDIRLGAHVILNRGVQVGHDCELANYVTVAPGACLSGAVRLGEGANLGTGASVIQNVEVGAWSMVGAGATVVRDLPRDVTAVGVPARVIRTRRAGWHLP